MALGPLGVCFLALGWFFYAALWALGVVVVALVMATRWVLRWVRARRRQHVATPRPAPGVEPWVRGHREVTVAERAIMAQRD